MERPPADYELLWAIYEQHHDEFVYESETGKTTVEVALDVPAIASSSASPRTAW